MKTLRFGDSTDAEGNSSLKEIDITYMRTVNIISKLFSLMLLVVVWCIVVGVVPFWVFLELTKVLSGDFWAGNILETFHLRDISFVIIGSVIGYAVKKHHS